MLAGFRPDGSAKLVLSRPSSIGFLVHPLDERGRAAVGDAGQRPGRGVVGSNQRQVQHIVERDAVVGAEIGRRGGVDVAALDGDFLRQVGVVFEEHQRGHHLGDAGDRALVLRVLFPQDLAGVRVENDGGRGADIRHQRAVGVGLVPRASSPPEAPACGPVRAPWRPRGRAPAGPSGLRRRSGVGRLPCGIDVARYFFRVALRGDVGARRHQRRAAARAVELRSEGGSNARILRYDSGWLGFNRCSELERKQCSNNMPAPQPEL